MSKQGSRPGSAIRRWMGIMQVYGAPQLVVAGGFATRHNPYFYGGHWAKFGFSEVPYGMILGNKS